MTKRIAHETRMNRARFASVAAQIVVLLYKQFCRFLHDVIVRLRYFLSLSLSLSLWSRTIRKTLYMGPVAANQATAKPAGKIG